jgi:hypothetical protein
MVPVLDTKGGPDSPPATREVRGNEAPQRDVQEHPASEVLSVASSTAVNAYEVLTASKREGICSNGFQSWRQLLRSAEPSVANQNEDDCGETDHADESA